MRRAAVAAVVAVLVTACGGDDAPADSAAPTVEGTATEALPTAACDAAFVRAAAVEEEENTVEDLHPAVRACTSFDDWIAASEKHPEALDDTDPEEFLTNVCTDPALTAAPLCDEVGS